MSVSDIFSRIKDKLLPGDKRSSKAVRNVVMSALFRGIDALTYLLLVPVTLGYLNKYEYGIWLTLNSILVWVYTFDIGFGNGLRNKLGGAVAHGDRELARKYVSTAACMLSVMAMALIVAIFLVSPHIDWYSLLSTTPGQTANLPQIVTFSFAIVAANFAIKYLDNIYQAMQMPSIVGMMTMLGHLLSLIIIYILSLNGPGNLLTVALIYTGTPLIVYYTVYPVTFLKIWPWLRPSVRLFRKKYLKSLFDLGVNFFILQLGAIVLFTFSNIIISHLFGPQEVTPYNIAYRYFSIMVMVFGILVSPVWSATTDAYERGDIDWIRRCTAKYRQFVFLIGCGLVVMLALSKWVYRIWVGPGIEIPYSLSAYMALYIMIIIYSVSYSNFLNGLGKIRLQMLNIVVMACIFYPLCRFLGERFGIEGIAISMCLIQLPAAILNTIQFNKVISGKAHGIWNR